MRPFPGVLALVLWTSVAITPAGADETLSAISRMLAKDPVICADFIQKKTLRALQRPLISQGRVVYVEDKGILWQVRQPFPTRLLIKRDALVRWNDAGEPQRLGFEQSPIFGSLARVFTAVFTGDIDPLRQSFGIESHISGSTWRLALTPRDKSFAGIITRIHATGGRFIHTLRIEERQSDQTQIEFSRMNTKPCQLDNAENGYFAQ